MPKLTPARWMVIVVVLLSYFWITPADDLRDFSRVPTNYYGSLAAGMLAGQLSLSVAPDPKLLKLSNPYDPGLNVTYRLQDASLYKDKYYIYFGVLPVLTVYIPVKLITGFFPSDAAVLLLFLAIGFVAGFLLLIKIKDKYFPALSETQLLFAGFLFGFANSTPYLLTRALVYEVAIASAFACISVAWYFFYNIFCEKITYKNVFFCSLFLALTVACRPHFSLVCIALFPLLSGYLIKFTPGQTRIRYLLTLLLPALCIACGLALYNYLRFDSIFEFGYRYQTGLLNLEEHPTFSGKFYRNIVPQLYYYFVQPELTFNWHPIPRWMHTYQMLFYEHTLGIFSATPCIIFLFSLPVLLRSASPLNFPRALKWFLGIITFNSLLILLLLTCLYCTAERYKGDFAPYLCMTAIVCVWLLISQTAYPRLKRYINSYYLATGIISMVLGLSSSGTVRNPVWSSDLTVLLFFLLPVPLLLTYFTVRLFWRKAPV